MKKIPEHSLCAKCGTTENLTWDHIIPKIILKTLCVSQTNERQNLQILCQACNTKKGHALEPKNPRTMYLLRTYISRYEDLYVTKRPRRKYVHRTLPVTSLTPDTIYMCSHREYLKSVYQKQIALRKQ